MYLYIEFYQKKTIGVSIATMIGTAINIVLNILLLPLSPENSFIIASYTTLAGYMVLFTIHYFIVRKMKMDHVYDIKFILIVLVSVLIFAMLMNILYSYTIIRWVLIAIYAGVVIFFGIKYKQYIIKLFFKKNS